MSRRREFLQASALAGGGLAIAMFFDGCAPRMKRGVFEDGVAKPNAWLRITPDDRFVLVLDRVEMGQGTMTSSAQMLAEELEIEPSWLEVEFAPVAADYNNRLMRSQITGDSTSTRSSWQVLPRAGAMARDMLRRTAARDWDVAFEEVRAEKGFCVAGHRRASYGQLASRSTRVRTPPVVLKSPEDYAVIGRPEPRLDARAKVEGAAVYGMDVRVPGMMYAVLARPPVFGAKLKSFVEKSALAVKGVEHVVETPRGVAVVARSTWAAMRGAEALEAEWTEGDASLDDARITREHQALLDDEGGLTPVKQGEPEAAFASAAKTLEARYEVPFLAHVAMEPMNCTVFAQAERCEVWVPSQAAAVSRVLAARACGLSPKRVEVHTTYLGGGFGRRSGADYVTEAATISKALGVPVQLVWPRADDVRHGQFRQRVSAKLEVALDGDKPAAWRTTLVSPSILGTTLRELASIPIEWLDPGFSAYLAGVAGDQFLEGKIADPTSTEGLLHLSYRVPGQLLRYHGHEAGVPVTFWRSVAHSFNAFFIESFVDEIAHATKQDPLALRLALLPEDTPHRAVLQLAADKAGWGAPPPAGVFRGLAQHPAYGSYCAMVVELSVERGRARVHRVVAAVDVGQVINPDIVRAQVEGGVVWGLSSALLHAITIAEGRVVNSNFHDFPVMRIHETPKIEVHLVDRPGAAPGGVGELAVPPVAPAVANAIFAATGQRVRRLPLQPELSR